MKILHTADWHLGARLGRQGRAGDLRRVVAQVFDHCARQAVDVLLIAGDLFHQGAWSDEVCAAVEHLKEVARPFLRGGGTIVALTGNHDHETVCTTLRHALELADPAEARPGTRWARGRFHLATRPTFFRLAARDADADEAQLVLLPYPTPSRYLDGEVARYGSADEKRRRLLGALIEQLEKFRADADFDARLPTVLGAHLYLTGATLSNGRSPSEADEMVCPPADLGDGWAYVALGHVHRPQAIGGHPHVRYSGSIDRISFDERSEAKGAILFEVGPAGLVGAPTALPIDATPMLDVVIERPDDDLARLEAEHEAIGRRALVRCRVTYEPGRDDLDAILRRVGALYPRCARCEPVEANPLPLDAPTILDDPGRHTFREVVLEFVAARTEGHADGPAIRAAAEALLAEHPN
jgi:exonuclease SbcD